MRQLLADSQVHPSIAGKIADYQRDLIEQVERALREHSVVMLGMAQNPFPRKARQLLAEQGIAFHELSIGSYFSAWRRRLALKMWTGWPTLPMIFIHGTFIGGYEDLRRLEQSGDLTRLVTKE